MGKGEGYVKAGEFLFVSKYRQLSIVVNPGESAIVNGRIVTTKPTFVDFQPSPFGGMFRTKKADVAEAVRNHQAVLSNDAIEITSDEELAAWVRLAERSKEAEERELRAAKSGAPHKTKALEPEENAPESTPAPTPKAARGPVIKRKTKALEPESVA